MRSPLVVPFDEPSEPGPEIPASHWDVKHSCVFVLQSTNEAFDHSNASVLADSAEAGCDLLGLAPALEPITPELATLVGDDVLWLGAVLLDRAIQELLILGAFSLADIVLKAKSASAESEIRRHLLHWIWRKSLLQAGNLSGAFQQFESATHCPLMGGVARCRFHPKGL